MSEPRLLLILGFPVGMGALLRQAAVGGFIAEHTGRQAVILWREQCLYWPGMEGSVSGNAFPLYFEPVGEEHLDTLRMANSWYPEIWSPSRLAEARMDNYVFERRPDHDALPEDLEALRRIDAQVVVMDHYMELERLLPAVHAGHPDAGAGYATVLHRHARRMLRPQGEWVANAHAFHTTHMQGKRVLGVHYRGTDKGGECPVPNLGTVLREASTRVTRDQLQGVFLATDSIPAAEAFQRHFGDRLLQTSATRSAGSRGVHLTPGGQYAKGMEVLIDMWLLSRCERLLLTRSSNVAAAVEFLLGDPEQVTPRISEPALPPASHLRHHLRRTLLACRASLRTLIRGR